MKAMQKNCNASHIGIIKIKGDHVMNHWRYDLLLKYLGTNKFVVESYDPDIKFDFVIFPLQCVSLRTLLKISKTTKLIGDVTDDITSIPLENYNYLGKIYMIVAFFLFILPKNLIKLFLCKAVVVGSVRQYERVSRFKKKVFVITDALTMDLIDNPENELMSSEYDRDDSIKIGWVGNAESIYGLSKHKSALESVARTIKCEYIFITSDNKKGVLLGKRPNNIIDFIKTFDAPCKFVPWSYIVAINEIRNCDLAILPISGNNNFTKSKPLGRLLFFMGLGVPSVVSPISSYHEYLTANPGVGFIARNKMEWLYYITILAKDRRLRNEIGCKAKMLAKNNFSTEEFIKKYSEAIKISALPENK